MPLLDIQDLNSHYGTVRAVRDASLSVNEGEVVAILGRNGAGKTTIMRSIMALRPPTTAGTIRFNGQDLAGLESYEVGRLAIGFAQEDHGLIPEFTVNENLQLALRSSNDAFEDRLAPVYDLFPVLEDLSDRRGRELSGGERRMTTIARALIKQPDLLLLDEPFEGLAPGIVEDLSERMADIRELCAGVVITESNVDLPLPFADRVYVLNRGAIEYEGPTQDFIDRRIEFSELLA